MSLMLDRKLQLKDILHQITGELSFLHSATQQQRVGSGILLTKDLILTPAYNIWDRRSQSHYEFHTFCPKQINDKNFYEIQEFYFLQEYKQEKKEPFSKLHNYGLMRLSQPSKGVSLCDILLNNSQKIPIQSLSESKAVYDTKQQQTYCQQKFPKLINEILYKQNYQEIPEPQFTQTRLRENDNLNLSDINISLIHPVNKSNKMQSYNKQASFQNSYLLKPLNPQEKTIYCIQQNTIRCINNNRGSIKQSIIGANPLKKAQKITFKVIKYGSDTSKIIFGVISSKNNSHKNSKRIFQFHSDRYDRNGKIILNEFKVNKSTFSLFIKQGQSLQFLIDFEQKQAKIWLSHDSIPLVYDDSSTQFYPFVQLSNKQDTVQLRIKRIK